MRLEGRSYLEIAEAGGGIASTMRQTRAASEDQLYDRCRTFLDRMAALGVTTVEAKSGYGLTVEDELKQLRVYRRLQADQPMEIVPTFLGAHTVPPEYETDRAGYLSLVREEMIPRVVDQNLAEFCDAFVEESAFQPDEVGTASAIGIYADRPEAFTVETTAPAEREMRELNRRFENGGQWTQAGAENLLRWHQIYRHAPKQWAEWFTDPEPT